MTATPLVDGPLGPAPPCARCGLPLDPYLAAYAGETTHPGRCEPGAGAAFAAGAPPAYQQAPLAEDHDP